MNAKSESIHLIVRNRKKIFFNDDIKSLTSINEKGIFDILPEHTNFICLIKEYITIHTLDGQKEKMDISNGVLKVEADQINCYIDLIADVPTTAPTLVPASK